MVFLKVKDMPTAKLDDLRYSKKRCDYLRNLSSGFGVALMALEVVMVAIGIPESIITSGAFDVFVMLLYVLLGAAGVIFSVLSKEEQKFFYIAMGCVIGYGIIASVTLEPIGMLATLLALIFVPVARYFYYYNENLKAIKGYPSFDHHDEHRKFEGLTRTKAIENLKNGGIVDADSFFEKDIKELRDEKEKEKEPDKTDWLRN